MKQKICGKAYRAGIAMVCFLAALVYFHSLSGHAFWDDLQLIQHYRSLRQCFTEPFLSAYYRPVVALSFYMEGGIWHNAAFGYHLTNLLLHVLTAAALIGTLRCAFHSRRIALLGGLLYAVQPAQISTVAWIGGRTDALCELFATLFLWALLGAARSGARRRFLLLAAAWMAFFAAILTKEQAFALLPLVPLAFLWFSSEQRLDWRAVAPFLVGSGLYLAMWHAVIPVFLRPPVYPWSYRLALGGATVSYYTHLLVAPSPATLFMVTARPFAGWSWILAGYGALALGWLGVWKWRRTRPALAWFLLMALLGILPVANLVPASGQALSAYRAGLAGLGVVALLAYAVGSLPRVRWQLAAASLLLVWYGSLTCWGEAQWQDALHVTRAGMQCDPESYFYREYHTYALLDAGQTQQALSETDALLDRTFQGRDWRDADVVASALQAPSFLARMAAIDGALSSPAAQIAKTLIVDGKLHLDAHHYAEAGQAFTAALRLNSADPNSHVGLGHVLTAEGDWQDGLRHYREAIHLQPATAFYYLVLANAEWRHRDREAALSTLQDGYDRVGQQKPLLSQWMRKIENAQARP